MLNAKVEELQITIAEKQTTGKIYAASPAAAANLEEDFDYHSPGQSDQSLEDLLKHLMKLNSVVKQLSTTNHRIMQNRLEKVKKFEEDYHDVSKWFRAQQEELSNVGSVRGVPEGIKEQLALHQVTLLPL